MQSAVIGASFALWILWAQRQGRWALFFAALSGSAHLVGTTTSTGQSVLPGTPTTGNPTNQPITNPATGAPYPTATIGGQTYNPALIAPSGQPIYGYIDPNQAPTLAPLQPQPTPVR